jgi:hypothetical protein
MIQPLALVLLCVILALHKKLDERISRTVDEHGVVRKQYLPGEVFAIPTMMSGGKTEGASDSRLTEMDDKLTSALNLVKGMRQEIVDLEAKLNSSERQQNVSNKSVAGNSERDRNGGKEMTSSPTLQKNIMPDNQNSGNTASLQPTKPPSPRASTAPLESLTASHPQPVTYIKMNTTAPTSGGRESASNAFSLVADIGHYHPSRIMPGCHSCDIRHLCFTWLARGSSFAQH